MDISGQIILAYLEEDDERKVLFRVRPVLSAQGAINPEDLEEYGEEGFLRVAPDRGEQHSFKERMRSLGKLCVINLQDSAGALFKVRPNKNYAPKKGETNRYIIYSDAVQALPPEMVYEVVSEDKSASSLTGQYYLRAGGRISGPHCPEGSLACPNSQTLMPDCERLFYVELPDGTSTMFYWPQDTLSCLPDYKATPAVSPEETPAPRDSASQAPPPDADQVLPQAAQTLHQALREAGFQVDEGQAFHLALLMAVSKRVQIIGDSPADAALAARLLKRLCKAEEQASPVRFLHRDFRGQAGAMAQSYLQKPWPLFRLKTADLIPGKQKPEGFVDVAALRALAREKWQGAGEEGLSQLKDLLSYTQTHQQPLPLVLRKKMAKALVLMEDGSPHEGLFESLAASFLIPYEQEIRLGKSITAAYLAQ